MKTFTIFVSGEIIGKTCPIQTKTNCANQAIAYDGDDYNEARRIGGICCSYYETVEFFEGNLLLGHKLTLPVA